MTMTDQSLDKAPPSESAEASGNAEPKVSFAELGLRPEVLKALADMGFSEAMDVQAKTIPVIREGRDILVQSRTGSGKTAAFAIPFADWIADSKVLSPQALVLLPTRELALQVAAETARVCATTPISVVPVYGGSPMGKQIEQLRAGAQVICGTPGRTLDHIRRGTLQLDKIKCVVLDECDEMLSMGFQEDIEAILSETPPERQTLLFSATVPEGIQRLSRRFMRAPEMLKLSADFVGVHEIRHTYYSIPGGQREAELLRILTFEDPERAVIFCNTRDETGRVAEHLRRHGFNAEPISSDLSQSEREAVMTRMRAGGIRFLVATDVAARGIDIENLPCVINYTFPESPEVYIHRTGRTGRAGKSGHAISLIGPTEVGSFYYLKLLYKIKPEERSLPSEAEVRSHREGERLAHLRSLFPGDPGSEWHSLAKRLLVAIDAERLVGSLLRSVMGSAKAEAPKQPAPLPPPEAPTEAARPQPEAPEPVAQEPDRRERSMRGEPRGRGYGERDRDRDRGGRPRPGRDRDRERDRPRERDSKPSERAERPVPETSSRPKPPSDDGREFWEVWSEEVGRTPTQQTPTVSPAAPSPSSPVPSSPVPSSPPSPPPAAAEPPANGAVRLYVNLGRKDGATPELVAEQLSASGVSLPASDIELMNTHSYINVSPDVADTLCQKMNGRLFNGRAIVCERARPPRRR
jgi:ATP-dependent RNA helicase DeaD